MSAFYQLYKDGFNDYPKLLGSVKYVFHQCDHQSLK